jgi:choline dehydrogenase-like flavoprotein
MIHLETDHKKRTYDAIVVGSGISGGWAAKELTERGLTVLMLDRGKPLEHITGYAQSNLDPWEYAHRGRLSIEQKQSHPYLSRRYPYGEHNDSFWFKDTDAPYTETKRYDWFRPNIVGGRSIMWGRQSYRLSDYDFEANAKEGIGADWPIRYADLAPWYEYAERFVGISGENLGLSHFPDQILQPPMSMNVAEKQVKQGLEKAFPDRRMTMGRVANLTQSINGRGSCNYRNICHRGCPYGAYFSTQSATLPAAMATKRLTLKANSIVNSILFDEKKHKAKGVLVIDSETQARTEYYAKIIFVCASTNHSTWLLMNSRPPQYLDGLGNESGVLGHYLMDHHQNIGASGVVEGFDDKYVYGGRPNGVYIPRFQNIGSDKRSYLRGFGYQGGAGRGNWSRVIPELGFGADMKEKATEPGVWRMGLGAFGEILPNYKNHSKLNFDLKDKWGQPTLTFDAELSDNELAMRKDMMSEAVAMLEAAGCKNVNTYDNAPPKLLSGAIHEMGTARMGKDPKTSVLNANNQIHTCKNVFVTDGSAMVSSGNVNPSLTYMALTARAAAFAVAALKKGEL